MSKESIVLSAIQSVSNSKLSYCKFLSANDSGATGGHQSGILVSKTAKDIMFNQKIENENILKRTIEIQWQNDIYTQSCFTYYKSKNELRITKFGRNFPFLNPEKTGSLFILTQQEKDHYRAFILETEDSIEQFLDAFGIASTETNRLINKNNISLDIQESIAIKEFIESLKIDFPSSNDMAIAARTIQNKIYNHIEYIQTNPDKKLIDWTNTEYALFRAIEYARYGDKISNGFSNVDEFITMANMVLNRRKSRAGKSLENHLSAIFDNNNIAYTAQAITEGKKKPDFLFPSDKAYHNKDFPVQKIVSLAAKTTCKDRWRQIINEADRLRDMPKFLCTLQQGISPSQMDEMHAEKVILVVPKPYIKAYPENKRDRIWTISKFVNFIKQIEI